MDGGDASSAGALLDDVSAALRSRVTELQELVLARNMYPVTAVPDLAAVDVSLTAMEAQVQAIRRRLQEELEIIPKAKKQVNQALKQQRRLQHMLANMPTGMREDVFATPMEHNSSTMLPDSLNFSSAVPEVMDRDLKIKEEPTAAPKKGKGPAPRWYISTEELDSLSSYMRGRLTLEKVNIAINEVASYADGNAHLVACTKKKLSEDTWEKALELRDIAATESVKGKHFFLETDIKGPGLKLDNTGKAILTVLRHLGRIHETRIGHHRVFILSKQH
ncbi:spindle and kinetochore-associated protein 1 homolog [Oryza brachyantha]|uniref:spindle and kinetochore-associated protein 1 homolog n=1 Tax=Oryza brachyantha TaxID=4533 RepID=UPI001ADC9D49|nr:spindle and kinetochore-associated protein 1 homolog [Oryza brachyantha]